MYDAKTRTGGNLHKYGRMVRLSSGLEGTGKRQTWTPLQETMQFMPLLEPFGMLREGL